MSVDICKAQSADCFFIAALHKKLLPLSFLGKLGEKFLIVLYKTLVDYNKGLLFVAKEGKEVIGFISGTLDTRDFYRYFLKRNFFRAGFLLLPRLIKRNVVRNLFETLKYGNKELRGFIPDAELLSVVVINAYQGKGISRELFKRFVAEFRHRGVKSFRVVVGRRLERAQRFYQKMECEKKGEVAIHKGEKSEVYVYNLLEK